MPSIRSAILVLLLASAAPSATTCGDGVLDPGEVCDPGIVYEHVECDPNCTLQACGNGYVSPWEECDDGNRVPGDGCAWTCRREECGNGVVDPGEACDDGNLADGDACDAGCRVEARDYLACYRARRVPGEKPRADRLRPVAVCWGDAVGTPTLQFVCYRGPSRARVTHDRVGVRDHVGEASLAVSRPGTVCVPSAGARVFSLVRAYRATGLDATYEHFGAGLAGTDDGVFIGGPAEPGSAVRGVVRRYDRASGALVATMLPPTVTLSSNGATYEATGLGRVIASSGERLLMTVVLDHSGSFSPWFPRPTMAALYDAASGVPISFHSWVDVRVGAMATLGSTVLVGDPDTSSGTFPNYHGALWAFRAGVFGPDRVRDPLGPGTPAAPRYFGTAVVALGGDAYVSGHATSPAPMRGFVERLAGGTWALRRVYESPEPHPFRLFGRALGVLGDRLVVGETSRNVPGAAWVFDPDSGAATAKLAEPAPGRGGFGTALAVRGTEVLVGAQFTDAVRVSAGAAHLYDGDTGERLATFLNPEPGTAVRFGVQVARAGEDVLVGTGGDGDPVGIVYQFGARRPPALRCAPARVRGGRSEARELFVADRVAAGKTKAGDPDALCTPDGEAGPVLACRRVRDHARMSGKVSVETAFGTQRLVVGSRRHVCLPAAVVPEDGVGE